MRVAERLDGFQQRHPWAGFPIAVVYKFADDQAGYLAALITYYGFLSLFPLLLLLSSVLGFVLQGDAELQQRILDSALSQFPVIGDQLGDPHGLRGSGIAVVVGLAGSVYGALGVAQALQNAMNAAWAVPRNRRPNPLVSRLRSVLLIAVGGVALLGATILTGIGSSADAFGASVGTGLRVLAVLMSVGLNAAVLLVAFRIGTAHPLRIRDAAPGAITAAVLWQLLQTFGAVYVGQIVKNASTINAVFAIVLGLIAWVYLAAVALLVSVQINVVRTKRLYPRNLLAPFTDDVDLTPADQRAYSAYATAQRRKEFESIDVDFDNDGQNASARRRSAADEP